ncbi:hypothetical protein HY251_06695 [bacterium]|nr:hypothetical protein [bacterium]
MDSPATAPSPVEPSAHEPNAAPAAVPAPASLLRRAVPLVLLGALAGGNAWFFQRDLVSRQDLRDAVSQKKDADDRARAAVQRVAEEAEALRAEKAALERAKVALALAERGGSEQLGKAREDLALSQKRAAELADRLGEAEARLDEARKARAEAERHARDLDALMDALKKKKINPRRLAGLEAPPRAEVEVVRTDERSVPPVLVLRLEDGQDGFEEGDVLYLTRTKDGRPFEAGRAVLERVDLERRLLSARVTKLDAGEKVSVGERLTTYPPGK